MTIHLITFASLLHDKATVESAHRQTLSGLRKKFTVNLVDYREIGQIPVDEFRIVFIATGGVEGLVTANFESLPRPTVMLADGMQNSLAAALEISAWLRKRDMKPEILHGEMEEILQRITELYTNFEARKVLREKKIGVLGTPSSWLVASNVDYLLAKRRWGVEFTDIRLAEVYDRFNKVTEEEIGAIAAQFALNAADRKEASAEDLLNSMRLYKALREVCETHELDAFTITCFKLIEKIATTGCVPLALLNNDGIMAGCEGDLQSVFTLLAVKAVTGQTGFMANPSLVNTRTNEILLAHCTIATDITERYIIRNHFESNSGVAIQGILPTGEVTVVKCSGECLDEFYTASGTLTANTDNVNCCRTQVKLTMDSPVDYFLRNPLGNHHIVVRGNHEKALHDFFIANGCKRVE